MRSIPYKYPTKGCIQQTHKGIHYVVINHSFSYIEILHFETVKFEVDQQTINTL